MLNFFFHCSCFIPFVTSTTELLYLKTNKQKSTFYPAPETDQRRPSQVTSQQTHTFTPWTFASQINNTRDKLIVLTVHITVFFSHSMDQCDGTDRQMQRPLKPSSIPPHCNRLQFRSGKLTKI